MSEGRGRLSPSPQRHTHTHKVQGEIQKNPRAHKNKIGPPPPPKTQNTPPPQNEEFYGHRFSCRKNAFFPGVHKIGAAISGPRIADTNFTDTRIFLRNYIRTHLQAFRPKSCDPAGLPQEFVGPFGPKVSRECPSGCLWSKILKLTLFRGGGGIAILWTKGFYGHLGVSEQWSSECHLHVLIIRRVPSVLKSRNSIAHKGVPKGSEQKNGTCLTPCIAVQRWSLDKCVILVRVRREVARGLPGTHKIACPKRTP